MISRYKNAPAAILALSNELSDLLLIIQEIRDQNLNTTTVSKLSVVLNRADSKLLELDHFVKRVGVLGTANVARRRYERLSWAGKNSRKAQELKQDLHDVKINIILLLSTATLSHVQLNHSNDVIVQSMSQIYVDDGESDSSPDATQALIRSNGSQLSNNTITIQVRAQQKVCNEWCSCVCHRRSKLRTPRFLDNVFGTLHLGYNGIPLVNPTCNESSCWQRTATSTSVMYYFPKWLMYRAISVALLSSLESTVSLKMPRIIDPEAEIFKFIHTGNVEGLKKLLEDRKASPNDIKGDKVGCSALHDALCWKEFAICKLLLQAGADPYVQNNRGETAMEYVHLNVFAAGRWYHKIPGRLSPWPPKQLAELAENICDSTFIHENGFSRLHKAVLRSQPGKLREELEFSTKDIDNIDGQGYTALSWAAARMDPECLEILLAYGADPALYKGSAGFLLGGLAVNTSLDEKMAKNRDMCLEVSIKYRRANYGDDYIDQTNNIGRTALMLACWADEPTAVSILLDAGADINMKNEYYETPLMYCVMTIGSLNSLHLVLNHPRLRRTLKRKPMLKILSEVQKWPNRRVLSLLSEANLSCSGLTQRDWTHLKKFQGKPWHIREAQLSDFESLWEELISGLKSRAGLPSFDPSGADSGADIDPDGEESDDGSQGSCETSSTESEDDSWSADDEFEDAVEF